MVIVRNTENETSVSLSSSTELFSLTDKRLERQVYVSISE